MQKITKVLIKFSDYLDSNWDVIQGFLSEMEFRDEFQKEDIISDWLQVHWELLVESIICQEGDFLEVYGSGAECNNNSERVRYPTKVPNYKIVCKPKYSDKKIIDELRNFSIKPEEMSFYKFVNYGKNGTHSTKSPFDSVLLEDDKGEFFLVKKHNVEFCLKPIIDIDI